MDIFNNQNIEDTFEMLKALCENAVDGIFVINARGMVKYMNPAASDIFGYVPEEVIGNNVHMLMPEPYHSEHDSYLNNYKTTGEKKIIGIGREVKGQKKNGSIFHLRLAVSEFSLREEKFFTGVIHDLTEVKEAEEKIKHLNTQLELKVKERTEELSEVLNKLLSTNSQLKDEVEERRLIEEELKKNEKELEKLLESEKELGELKSRFVSTASHEFRTPLSTILSSVSLISRYIKEEEQGKRDKHIDRIKMSVRHLSGILNDFLSLSKLDEGKVTNQPNEVEWSGFIEDVFESINVTLKPGQYITAVTNNIPSVLYFDEKLLKNILFNLFSNASKYSEEGKEIIFKADVEGETLKISIQDFGIGIPKEEQSHLFSRFYRAKNADNIKGTGLGLNIVQRYVRLMNGEISFESEQWKGSIFTITIPVK